MINKITKRHLIGFSFIICHLSFSIALTSCSEWDDHYEGAQTGTSLTLWQQLQQHPELSDFCQVLEQTKVFRMHKKTPVSYAQLLDGGQSFTVVAPVNGTFNRDSLIRLTQTHQGDSVAEKFFVLNHISRSTSSMKDYEQSMLMLNSKHMTLSAGTIEGVALKASNLHAKNGVLHIAERPLPYEYNLYEALCDMADLSAIGNFLRQYDEDYFDADASVSSGIVEGVPVYVDSVVIERNRMLQRIGLINAEDSTYWIVVPTTDGWNRAWDEATKYFVYDATVLKRDSIQQYWTHRGLMDDAVFSLNVQPSPQDSLISPQYDRKHPEYHVFYKPFTEGIMSHPVRTFNCSNGTLYETAAWPFTPEQTYFRELKTEGEETTLILDYGYCNYNKRVFSADSVSESGYLDIVPATGTSNWNMIFKLENTLSGTYDIYAIVLPKSVYNPLEPDLRPCKFKAAVNYVDEQGKEKTYDCENTVFQTDPLRVDTVLLASKFRFPASNYGQVNTKISLKLTCNILARETSRFAREMYLDCIYLRPSKKEE